MQQRNALCVVSVDSSVRMIIELVVRTKKVQLGKLVVVQQPADALPDHGRQKDGGSNEVVNGLNNQPALQEDTAQLPMVW